MMIQNNLIHEGERLDELQRNGYGIIQNPARFCFGMDAVLLAGFARVNPGERAIDPVLRKQRQGKKYWILEPAPELFRF